MRRERRFGRRRERLGRLRQGCRELGRHEEAVEALLPLIGGPLLLIGNVGVLFDAWDQTGAVSILVVPEFLWELSLGIYTADRSYHV